MRFSSAVFFAGNALAIAQQECLAQNSADLAAYADCADQSALAGCLSKLESPEVPAVQGCYTDAGCSSQEAIAEARRTWQRCEELAKGEDLKKRFPAAPLPTIAPRVVAAGPTLFKRETADLVWQGLLDRQGQGNDRLRRQDQERYGRDGILLLHHHHHEHLP